MTLQSDLFSLESKFALLRPSEPGVKPRGNWIFVAAKRLQWATISKGAAAVSVSGESMWSAAKVLAVSTLAVVALSGCAAFGVSKDSDLETKQKVVTERAEARWNALIKADLDAAYTFLSAGSKATTSLLVYKASIKPGRWREAKVEKVECEAEVCRATVNITFDDRRMKGIQMPLVESWIIENRSAWYVYR